jgi:hypothetical protein
MRLGRGMFWRLWSRDLTPIYTDVTDAKKAKAGDEREPLSASRIGLLQEAR